ncbi:MAG: hypothetical protein QXG08_06360 [Candidatus Methanomethyliaceae archaeon]
MRKIQRVKKCVICGADPKHWTGYIFFEDGKEQIGAPWCQEHYNQRLYNNPVFENESAKELFAKKHPRLYAKIEKAVFLGRDPA